jgi:soluble lytic murein transglycosylase-like protein
MQALDAIKLAAGRYGLSEDLIKSVIHTESGGNAEAISPKGAIGLMQLMPRTAKEMGVTNPYDVTQNILGGTKYLKSLVDRYKGDVHKALAAYNWGPGNVDKAGSMYRLPEETVNYVNRVTSKIEDNNRGYTFNMDKLANISNTNIRAQSKMFEDLKTDLKVPLENQASSSKQINTNLNNISHIITNNNVNSTNSMLNSGGNILDPLSSTVVKGLVS